MPTDCPRMPCTPSETVAVTQGHSRALQGHPKALEGIQGHPRAIKSTQGQHELPGDWQRLRSQADPSVLLIAAADDMILPGTGRACADGLIPACSLTGLSGSGQRLVTTGGLACALRGRIDPNVLPHWPHWHSRALKGDQRHPRTIKGTQELTRWLRTGRTDARVA